ncbi:RING finger protein 17-like [Pollicipes pollicipes]|uniref:RING finger protein 17-like n=1 Tax=Pollicipes pollicipes TaxID=41117 RepID=UPI0018853816|nr:RING finger protein 17-like [Pollicipes pollicipes]
MQPAVQLVAESDLPLDHVVKDITPEMLSEEDPVRDTASVTSEASARSAQPGQAEVVGLASHAPAPPRLTSSPRPPDRRLAAVFPARDAPSPSAARAEPPALSPLGQFGQEQVLVTHIRSPSQFYVQRCAQEPQLRELMRRVAQWCRGADSQRGRHTPPPGKNEPCLAQYAGDKLWYRARVVDVYPPREGRGPCEYEVFYVDYGNQARVLEERLRPMPSALGRESDMAVGCTLWDLVPADGAALWSPQATNAFASLVRGEVVVMTTINQRDALREVELLKMPNKNIKTDSPQSVRDHLVFISQANFVGAPDR